MQVLMLTPEPPYPLNGGGAFRTASLLHYFARFAEVDLILISASGRPADLPPGLVRSQQVIALPHHNRGTATRYFRNAGRAVRGVPPLIDRFAGLSAPIERAIGELNRGAGRRYDFGIVEHFWCAPYVDLLRTSCTETVLDLHNVESVLHERCSRLGNGRFGNGLIRAGHGRFAAASRKLESTLLPRFSAILAASEEDARQVRGPAQGAPVHVYPNSLPWVDVPQSPEFPRLVFSGNFEYHPNIDAVRFLVDGIWPELRRLHPELRLRLVGRGDRFIRHLLPSNSPEAAQARSVRCAANSDDTAQARSVRCAANSDANMGIEVTGPVADARAEIAQARIVVAPLRAGSGTRIKILEAWAAARCVVATPLAAEGLAARDGVNIALESDPQRFAARVAMLLDDSAARQRLAAAGRRTFEDNYSWETVWKNLDMDLQLTLRPGVNGYTGTF